MYLVIIVGYKKGTNERVCSKCTTSKKKNVIVWFNEILSFLADCTGNGISTYIRVRRI